MDAEGFAAYRDWLLTIGNVSTVTECTEAPLGDGVIVTCDYTHQHDIAIALGKGPFTGRYEVVIVDGKVQEVIRSYNSTGPFEDGWKPFTDWLQANHPIDYSQMTNISWDNALGRVSATAKTTPESLALWERYADEYLAMLDG